MMRGTHNRMEDRPLRESQSKHKYWTRTTVVNLDRPGALVDPEAHVADVAQVSDVPKHAEDSRARKPCVIPIWKQSTKKSKRSIKQRGLELLDKNKDHEKQVSDQTTRIGKISKNE